MSKKEKIKEIRWKVRNELVEDYPRPTDKGKEEEFFALIGKIEGLLSGYAETDLSTLMVCQFNILEGVFEKNPKNKEKISRFLIHTHKTYVREILATMNGEEEGEDE